MSNDTFKDLEDVVEDTPQNLPIAKDKEALAIFGEASSLDELLEDNQGLQMQLASIKIPGSGGTTFELEDPTTGETEPKKELKGIILASVPTNVYYESAYDGDSVPPDCSSMGGVFGTVLEDGTQRECKSCPFNQFGSGANGGKACQNRTSVYILLEGETLPRLFSLPATATQNYNKFRSALFVRKARLASVLVSIKLEKVQSKSGIPYSRPTFAVAGKTVEQSAEMQQAALDSIMVLKCMGILKH